ncbi:MAG: glycosyltransferase family 39 protein [Parcubacteria group bacterium]|jgi:4-amino-4-deoxy-L-arabinose transferase-like glycosyltransferase
MNLFGIIREKKKVFVLLLAIIALGIFLRTYHYSDLLRFGKDQARDASIVHNIIEKKEPLPLLGPKAGGTDFQMGPVFYYFQYASASIFGATPDKMAYPDLLFSILTIPLLFLFLRKYLNTNISLALTALFAVSFFAVQNGRFAWNPNSLPFFSLLFLYAFLQLAETAKNKKLWWSLILGFALGIGAQLHTLFILIASVIFILFCAYLIRKKNLKIKWAVLVIAVALLFNIPQIISEIQTKGSNTKAFFQGITQKTTFKHPFPKNIMYDGAWHLQANTLFVAPIGDDTSLHITSLADSFKDNEKGIAGITKYLPDLLRIVFGIALTLGGYFLLGFYLKKEKDVSKKMFLQLLSLYIAAAFFVMIPLSFVLELRYFLIVQFVPFLLLGLLIKFFREKYGQTGLRLSLIVILLLCGLNIYKVASEFNSFLNRDGDVGIAIWSEEKFAGEFILAHTQPEQDVHMVFEPAEADKFIRPLAYFDENIDAPLEHNDDTPLEDSNVAYFSLILDGRKGKDTFKRNLKKSDLYIISDSATYGRLAIYKLELKEK